MLSGMPYLVLLRRSSRCRGLPEVCLRRTRAKSEAFLGLARTFRWRLGPEQTSVLCVHSLSPRAPRMACCSMVTTNGLSASPASHAKPTAPPPLPQLQAKTTKKIVLRMECKTCKTKKQRE
jgi:hypothetical protein